MTWARDLFTFIVKHCLLQGNLTAQEMREIIVKVEMGKV